MKKLTDNKKRESIFNLRIPVKNGFFYFNTLSKSLIKLNSKKAFIPTDHLTKLGFFVDEGTNEVETVKYWLHRRQYSNDELSVEILGTNNCNLMCEYCLAYFRRNKGNMSTATLNNLIGWIQERIEETNPRKVRVFFSGGEPTLRMDIIQKVANSLKKIKGPIIDLCILTNGTNLNKETTEKLKDLGIRFAQIAIDGPKEIHDSKRPYVNPKISSFDLILENLKNNGSILDTIYLRINIDYENYTYAKELLRYLKDALPKKVFANISLQLVRIIEMENAKNDQRAQKRIKQFNKEAANWIVDLYAYAKKIGFRISINLDNIFDPHGPCMLVSRNSFIITPQGLIYKCTGLTREEKFSIGNVRTGLNKNVGLFSEKTMSFVENNKCAKCTYLPVCFGGCRNLSYVYKNDLWEELCPKDYFNNCSKKLISVLYE